MTIASIASISGADVAAQIAPDVSVSSQLNKADSTGGVFDTLLSHLENVNTQLINTDHAVQQLARGETDNLHQVMISLEQTRMTFDLLLQVRNKVMDAYQEVMRMQV